MDKHLFLSVLRAQVKPATGCTEPVAVALAAAHASHLVKGDLVSLKITASQGLYKNAYAVGLPGMAEKGIDLAGAIGYMAADPEKGMQILEKASEKQIEQARQAVNEKKVWIGYIPGDAGLFVRVEVVTSQDQAEVVISGSHDHVVRIVLNGTELLDEEESGADEQNLEQMRETTIASIVAFAETVDPEDVRWLLEGVRMNAEIAHLGLEEEYGLGIGRGLRRLVDRGILCNDLLTRIRMQVAAASDARMGGARLPVMTSCGSGNQGILIVIPLAAACQYHDRREEDLLRALVIGHLVNAYAKSYLGKLSPLCGCSVSAGLGTAAGLTWLADPDIERIEGAIKGMLSNLTGTICDGAKGSCALKLETAAVEAFTYAMLATQDVYVREAQGVVEESCDLSIRNLERIGRQGMGAMDQSVLEILSERSRRDR